MRAKDSFVSAYITNLITFFRITILCIIRYIGIYRTFKPYNKLKRFVYRTVTYFYQNKNGILLSFQIYTFPHVSYSICKHKFLKKRDYVIVRLTIAIEKADKNAVVEES